ncbi:poly(hydroxyalkanoate) depolymerase family esterase [Sphingomonas zeicaulis]|uniref:extracellular catalytic domain type 1 short-chain-length polyhydroxyalkanoate depolymerase n=1 Tax=Sphingomonas zeicaulis TaxID=1632740 RepID=UPI003D1D84F9
MVDMFKTVRKATRLMKKRRPVSAALELQKLLVAPVQKPPRKRAARPASAKAPRRSTAVRAPARPAPGSFIAEDFTCAHGTLAYRFYTPTGSNRRRMPLVVMLHGCSQTARDFATGTAMNRLADELGFLVLYPEQARTANPARCWNWHRPDNQRRGKGEPAIIAALTRHAMAIGRANPARIYIAGISAGGATAAIVGAAYPDLYTAVGVHSGVAVGDVATLSGAIAAMRGTGGPRPTGKLPRQQPTIVFHGDHDRIVHPSNAAGFLSNLERAAPGPLTVRTLSGQSPGGRMFTRRVYQDRAGHLMLEDWTIHGSGHGWSGGSLLGSHTDPAGPDASREMLRFFLAQKREDAKRKPPSPA